MFATLCPTLALSKCVTKQYQISDRINIIFIAGKHNEGMTQAQHHHWVVDVDGDNRLLYQNSMGETQYDPPSNLYLGKLGVPEGYLPVKSAEGVLYYLNLATMATTWIKPTEPVVNNAASTTKTPQIFSLIDPRLLHPENEPQFFLPPPKEALPPLPPQWENHFDSTTGLEYYYNRKTKKSTWERPTMEDIDSAPPLTLTCPRCHAVFNERHVFLRHLQANLHASGHSCDFHEG